MDLAVWTAQQITRVSARSSMPPRAICQLHFSICRVNETEPDNYRITVYEDACNTTPCTWPPAPDVKQIETVRRGDGSHRNDVCGIGGRHTLPHSLPAMVHRHKRLILVLAVLVLLPAICVAAFSYLLSLTVPPGWLQVFEITEQKAWRAGSSWRRTISRSRPKSSSPSTRIRGCRTGVPVPERPDVCCLGGVSEACGADRGSGVADGADAGGLFVWGYQFRKRSAEHGATVPEICATGRAEKAHCSPYPRVVQKVARKVLKHERLLPKIWFNPLFPSPFSQSL